MPKPVVFKDIGKSCTDLLTKDWAGGSNILDKSEVKLESKTPNGIVFTPKATKNDTKLDGNLAAKYVMGGGMETEVTLATSGVLKGTFEAANVIAKGLVVKMECETPAPGKSGLLSSGLTDVNYKTGPFDCKASYDFYKGDLTACASGTFSGVTLGAECGYSTTKSALSKYAAACQYVQPDFTVSAKMAEVMKTPGSVFSGAYYHKVSSTMQVGAEIKKAASKSDVDLAFGCLYKLDKSTTVKGKVDSDGKLFASFKQQLSPLTLLTLVSEVDTVNLNEGKHKFGMAMSLTP
jgi:voltage-dependent anion channel protein 2